MANNMKTEIKRVLMFILIFTAIVIITFLAAIINDLYPDFVNNGVVQFFLSLAVVVGFFVGLFLVIFIFVMGAHAAISKDPVEKNLSEEMLKKRLKNMAIFTVLILWSEYELKKFRDWWHKKS